MSNIKLSWTDTGWINYINFHDAKKLLNTLGSCMLSPIEYWLVYRDAKEDNDLDMINELTSPDYCEWLDRVYLRDGFYIDHPEFDQNESYFGKKHKTTSIFGRPGWFTPENNINYETGEPLSVNLKRDKASQSWKYWSPDHSVTKLDTLAPIRGYVTSVGKPSFDVGIPTDSAQPVQIIRECKTNPINSSIPIDIQNKADDLLKTYHSFAVNLQDKTLTKRHETIGPKIKEFIETQGKYYIKSKELQAYKTREMLLNSYGLYIAQIQRKHKEITFNDYEKFVIESKANLENALKTNKDIVFVMGHKNPDADAIVSSSVEAFRNHLMAGDESVYIPIIQYHKIPEEVRELVGDKVSDSFILSNDPLYIEAKETGLARWISVDQNLEPEVQKYFVAIIDHHAISESAQKADLLKTLEMVGSSTALVTQKILGMELTPDERLATILYGATLMDTENRVSHKMTLKDKIIMDYLKLLSKTKNDNELYGHLMGFLLDAVDTEILFKRDYKQDWGFGFAVAKVKSDFNNLPKLLELLKENTLAKNLPLTILRITEYASDNITVNKEIIYCDFSEEGTNEFKEAIWKLLENIILFEFPNTELKRDSDYIEFWGTGMQLSRKKVAPIVEVVVKAFSEYFYSKTTNLWIKRTFLTNTSDVKKAAQELGITIFADQAGRINYITYSEAKALAESLGFTMLSLPELWNTLDDAHSKNDLQMIDSLQGSNFVEFIDTILVKEKEESYEYNHPKVQKGVIGGNREKVLVPHGNPGLIRPEDIDRKTGIPTQVRPPNEYGKKGLWRFWEPDADIVLVTRSYIFLLQQPCWDGKSHIEDSLPNLGIRPCYSKLPIPKVDIKRDNKKLHVSVIKNGDSFKYSWRKGEA